MRVSDQVSEVPNNLEQMSMVSDRTRKNCPPPTLTVVFIRENFPTKLSTNSMTSFPPPQEKEREVEREG